MPFFATWQHRFGAAGSLETLARRDRPLISTLACPISAEQLSARYYSSATYKKAIDRPILQNSTTPIACPNSGVLPFMGGLGSFLASMLGG
jgi:hypothetical protein